MDRVSASGAIRSGLVPQLKHRAPHRAFPLFVVGGPKPVAPRWATLGSAWKMRAGEGRARPRPRPPPSSKIDGPTRGRRCPPVCGGARQYRLPPADALAGLMQALRLRERRNLAQPPRTLAWLRAERVAMGVCGLPDLWEACIFRVARCTRGSERGWNPFAGAHHTARSVIRDPCELHCACRSVTESIPS